VTTDAGLLAVRELDEALGLTEMAGVMIKEGRTGRNIRHDLAGLLRQSVYARLAGYEDVNDQEGQRLLLPGREIRQAAAREMEEPGTGTPAGSRQLAQPDRDILLGGAEEGAHPQRLLVPG